VNLLPPTGHGFLVRSLTDLLEDGDHLAQHTIYRTNDRNIRLDGLGDGCRIDVHVDDLGVWTELGRTVDDPVIKARAYSQDHIGMVHSQVGRVAAVHAEHADELPVTTG